MDLDKILKYANQVRPYIVFCYVVNVDLSGDNLKQFISLQTK